MELFSEQIGKHLKIDKCSLRVTISLTHTSSIWEIWLMDQLRRNQVTLLLSSRCLEVILSKTITHLVLNSKASTRISFSILKADSIKLGEICRSQSSQKRQIFLKRVKFWMICGLKARISLQLSRNSLFNYKSILMILDRNHSPTPQKMISKVTWAGSCSSTTKMASNYVFCNSIAKETMWLRTRRTK